jgi:hypothetical protein
VSWLLDQLTLGVVGLLMVVVLCAAVGGLSWLVGLIVGRW